MGKKKKRESAGNPGSSSLGLCGAVSDGLQRGER